MKCPYCGFSDDKVIDSRPADDGSAIRRRRECISCSKRFTTFEKVESTPIIVIKRDMTRQVFDRSRILGGLLKACEKRPVPIVKLEKLIDEVEAQISNSFQREVTTRQIGEMVMERLRKIDDVAYVRFASVYRQFKDIESFMEILRKLQSESGKETAPGSEDEGKGSPE